MIELDLILSWSGHLSHEAAQALYEWLPDVLPGIKPWISSEDIRKGTNWFPTLMLQLEKTSLCVICVTPENVGSPWTYYEAGAIAAKRDHAHICTLLIGVEGNAISETPLSQFQWTKASEKSDVWKLVRDINTTLENPHNKTVLEGNFNSKWPSLKKKMDKCIETLRESAEQAANAVTKVMPGVKSRTPQEIKILIEASQSKDGIILHGQTTGGYFIQVNNKNLVPRDNPRDEAAYRAAVKSLRIEGLLDARSEEVFSISQKGYEVAETLMRSEENRARQLDDNDIVSILETWIGKRTRDDNTSVIAPTEVDSELNLPPGSAARLLEQAAKDCNYVLDRRGANTIKFKDGPRPASSGPSIANPMGFRL